MRFNLLVTNGITGTVALATITYQQNQDEESNPFVFIVDTFANPQGTSIPTVVGQMNNEIYLPTIFREQ